MNRNLNQGQFGEYSISVDHIGGDGAGFVSAWHGGPPPEDEDQYYREIGRRVGALKTDGVVQGIEVHPDHRRRGIATAMWGVAKEAGLNPAHSDIRSELGDKWSRSLQDGSYFPPRHIY